jgi:hypothetical protein
MIIDMTIKIIIKFKNYKQIHFIRNGLINSSIILGTSALVHFLINYLLIPSTKETITFFPVLFDFKHINDVLLNALNN